MFYSHRITEKIRHHECDAAGNLKLHSLFDRLQNAAAEHAAILNVGMDELAQMRLIWVLSRLKIQLLRPLTLGEELTVTTFPTGIQRIFAHRCYDLQINGQQVGYAGSFWLPVNAATGKPVNAKKVLPPEIIDLPDVEKFFADMDKLPDVQDECRSTFKIGAGDIDLNRHLNNAIYARWITDLLGEKLGRYDFSVSQIQLNYLAAGQFGETIQLRGDLHPDGSFTVAGEKSGASAVFQAAGKFFHAG